VKSQLSYWLTVRQVIFALKGSVGGRMDGELCPQFLRFVRCGMGKVVSGVGEECTSLPRCCVREIPWVGLMELVVEAERWRDRGVECGKLSG